jgi:formate-nitrite transporter family protein
MSSDLQEERGAELEPKKTSGQILQHEIQEGRTAIRRPVGRLFLSGLSAGLDIGFSLFLIAVAMTRFDGVLPPPVLALLTANLYAVGFIFVVVGRSELFTEQPTLAVLPVLNGKATITDLFRTWGVVYCANLAGAAAFAALAVVIGPALGIIDSAVFGRIALSFTEADGAVILMSGLLAGWLMGLLSWLVAASRDTISQIVLTWLIASVIGSTRLHHVVVGSVEVLAGVFSAQEVPVTKYLHFLFWTMIGNSIGGPFFVAIIKYSHAIGGESGSERGDQLTFDRTGGAERDIRFQERFW